MKQEEIPPEFYDEEYFQGGKVSYDDYGNAEGIFRRLVPIICGKFKPRKLLEIGCAYGHFVKHIKHGIQIGIDISHYAIIKRSITPKVMLASATHLPFREKTFDVIVSFETLEHLTVPQIQQTFKEIDRVGTHWLCFTSPAPGDHNLPINKGKIDPSHVTLWEPEQWIEFGESMGWKHEPRIVQQIKRERIVYHYRWRVYVFNIAKDKI